MLKYGHGYTDAGAEYYEAQHHERALRNELQVSPPSRLS